MTILFSNLSRINIDMGDSLVAHLMTGRDDPFCQMLDEAGVKYVRRPRPVGVVMASGDAIQIAADALPHAAWATAVASVLVAWIKSRTSRKVNFTTKDNQVVHAFEGMSVDEIEKLLELSKSIMVLDTDPKPQDKDG